MQEPLHHGMKHGGLGVARHQDTNSACSALVRPARGGFSVFLGVAHKQDFSDVGFYLYEILFVLRSEAFHTASDLSRRLGNDILNRRMERWMVQKAASQQRVERTVWGIGGECGMQSEQATAPLNEVEDESFIRLRKPKLPRFLRLQSAHASQEKDIRLLYDLSGKTYAFPVDENLVLFPIGKTVECSDRDLRIVVMVSNYDTDLVRHLSRQE